jgi:peptidoglycan hydrolase CwlO-like protein
MPTITTDIDFEVICDECGTGLCSSTRVKNSTAYVEPCPKCMAQKDYEIKELQELNDSLNDELDRLKKEIDELE